MRTSGFHAGELDVQNRAGVRAVADARAGMLDPADLHEGIVRFLADRTFAPLAARDADGRLWVTALEGCVGFLESGPDWLRVHAPPAPATPCTAFPRGRASG